MWLARPVSGRDHGPARLGAATTEEVHCQASPGPRRECVFRKRVAPPWEGMTMGHRVEKTWAAPRSVNDMSLIYVGGCAVVVVLIHLHGSPWFFLSCDGSHDRGSQCRQACARHDWRAHLLHAPRA